MRITKEDLKQFKIIGFILSATGFKPDNERFVHGIDTNIINYFKRSYNAKTDMTIDMTTIDNTYNLLVGFKTSGGTICLKHNNLVSLVSELKDIIKFEAGETYRSDIESLGEFPEFKGEFENLVFGGSINE